MNPRIKTLWLAELRDENNQQGTGRLRRVRPDGVEFCCLGLLCEIAVREGAINPPVLSELHEDDRFYVYCSDDTQLLPEAVYRWAELPDPSPNVTYPSTEEPGYTEESNLAELNDDGWSFERIADLIEAQL